MKKAHRYNLGVIGNCHYMAYIDTQSSVSWMCWPSMDSSFVFGNLLDDVKGGNFQVLPLSRFHTEQRYVDNTAVLTTRFFCEDGSFEVIDFAPRFKKADRFFKPLQFFRKIKYLSGKPRIKIICEPRGHYGETIPGNFIGSNHICFTGLHMPIRLTTNASKTYLLENREFFLTEDLYLILSGGEPFEAPHKDTFEEFLQRTILYWRDWIKASYVPNIFQKEIIRSAITIKMHQFEDTGAILASGTTSLPEYPYSGRNWDYRYCWIRDSYFSLAAMNSLGHFDEAERYLHFIHNVTQEVSKLQPVYRLNGATDITERIIPLKGYLNSDPVRIGNAAYFQKQYDSFGQVILSLLPLYLDERIINREKIRSLDIISELIREIKNCMDLPDAGIWEFRGKTAKHLETYVFHWAGAKAAMKIATHYQDEKLCQEASEVAKLSEMNIEKCYCPENECYMSDQDRQYFDASAFLLIIMNYLNPEDERTHKHFQRLQKELLTPEGMIYRYRALDDFGETHATFLICTYWYIECLIVLGFLKEAYDSLKNVIQHSNHLGLLSEDLSSEDGGQWGNFPQNYSHVGLINTACRLARKQDLMVFE
jgi:GH15 family glucan-1,4-alpha-glucosidase